MPYCAPNGVDPVSVALLATDRTASVDVKVASGKTVPVKVTVPPEGGVTSVDSSQAPYTPVPSAASEMAGITRAPATTVVVASRAMAERRRIDEG